jgi:hypothetical protein
MSLDSLNPAETLVGFDPQYVASGHLIYLSRGDGGMMALPFDGRALEVTGGPVPVLEDVRKEETHGFGHFAASEDGTLAYAPGGNAHRGYLGTVDRTGSVDTLSSFPKDQYDWLALSPDGNRLLTAMQPEEGGASATWVLTLDRGLKRELDIDETYSILPWFWIDEDRFLFLRSNPITQVLIGLSEYSLVDGSERSVVDSTFNWPALHPDGSQMMVSHRPGGEMRILSWQDGSVIAEIPNTGFQHAIPPNRRWHAFMKDDQILVAPFPYTGTLHQITDGPAEQPRWSAAGGALFFRGIREFWRVPVDTGDEFRAGGPELFARGPFTRLWAWTYAVTPEERILTVLGPPDQVTGHLQVVAGFFEELKQIGGR